MTDATRIDERLDCSGLLCPLPVYKAGLALNAMASGSLLELTTTDPGALEDIPAMARQRGDTLVDTKDNGATQVFVIRKGGG
ncbi:MAG: sulfurtransferase TusA family protein [Acidimicrobiia bacterium]